jgi:prephenate dehydrogenase
MPSPATDDAAIRAMTYLVTAMGAVPFFIDAAEHDALVAGVDQLPALLATLLNALYGTRAGARRFVGGFGRFGRFSLARPRHL